MKLNISTIIPNYNHGHLIKRSIESVVNQNFPPKEVIVVDDGSNDDSVKIVKDLQLRNTQIKLIEIVQNSGAVNAGRLGVKHSLGNYLHFLAADDFLLPDAYTKFHDAFSTFPNKAFYAGEAILFQEENSKYSLRPLLSPSKKTSFISSKSYSKKLRFEDNHFLGMSIIVNKKIFENFNGFDSNLNALSDSFLFRKMALNYGFVYVPLPITQWNISLNGDSRKLFQNRLLLESILPYARNLIENDSIFPYWYGKKFQNRNNFAVERIGNEVKFIRKLKSIKSKKSNNIWYVTLVKFFTFFYLSRIFFLFLKFRPYGFFRILKNISRHARKLN